jgi:3-oxoacyl-[acyl-carrier-protein] synthase II
VRRRVVITGVGVVSPLGLDAPSTWAALVAGKSGIGPITKFDASAFSCRIGGEVRGFVPENYIDRKEVKKMDTFIHFAIAASREAMSDSGLTIDARNGDRVGVYIGSGIGGMPLFEETHKLYLEKGPRKISPFFIPGMIVNLAAGHVSILFGAKGPNLACATACATGNHAIGEAMRLIREDYADAMIAGGTDAVIVPLAVGGFCAMKALSTRNDDPERASRPFDGARDGFVIGEGAGILVLEEKERAIARGASIYAELAGYGLSGDAFHISAPSPDGEGAARAMRGALRDAGIDGREVDYINAHGTSTPVGDAIETLAVKTVFGAHAKELAFASTKSMTGHLLGAAGGLESAITALALRDGIVPPTINYVTPDPACDLDCVPNTARRMPIRAALNNSFGFGGTNASLLLTRHHA